MPDSTATLEDLLDSAQPVADVDRAVLDGAPAPDAFFDGGSFVPLRVAEYIRQQRELARGIDPEADAGTVMEYDQGRWRPAYGLDVEAAGLLRDKATRHRVREVLNSITLTVPQIPWIAWNPHRRLVNCRSGMLDPATGDVRPHRPGDYSTFQAPVEFDPNAESQVLDNYLQAVLEPDSLDLFVQMLGYLLVPVLAADTFFVWEGPAGTGKTTGLDAVLDMIGAENWEQVTLQDLAENRFAPARLENKLVGMFDDLESTSMKTVSQIKALTGGHPWLTVERKHQNAYRAPLYARLIFTCNEMPRAADKSQAWYDRLVLIPFRTRFRDTSREDKDMPEKLGTPEAKRALFTLGVAGLQELMGNGWRFADSASADEELKLYRLRNDSVAAFVDECCLLSPHVKVAKNAFYDRYKKYCEEAGLHAVSRRHAYARLREDFGCADGQAHSGTRFFQGVGLEAQ